MLVPFTTNRFALYHSPLRERREIFFAATGKQGTGGTPDKDTNATDAQMNAAPEAPQADPIGPERTRTAKKVRTAFETQTEQDPRTIEAVLRDIMSFRQETRGKLASILGSIDGLPLVREHAIVDAPRSPLRELLAEARERIEGLLDNALAQADSLNFDEVRSIKQQTRIDQLVVKSAKVNMSPSCNCK
jgi:hypothetical protein